MTVVGLFFIISTSINLLKCEPQRCQTGTYSGNGHIICGSQISGGYQELWIHHTNSFGTYDMLSICQSFGYTSVYQSKGTYGSICGYGQNTSYSCNNVQSWSSMWPKNENLWTKNTYTDCCTIAWVCHRMTPSPSLGPTIEPTINPTLFPSNNPTNTPTKIPSQSPAPKPKIFKTLFSRHHMYQTLFFGLLGLSIVICVLILCCKCILKRKNKKESIHQISNKLLSNNNNNNKRNSTSING